MTLFWGTLLCFQAPPVTRVGVPLLTSAPSRALRQLLSRLQALVAVASSPFLCPHLIFPPSLSFSKGPGETGLAPWVAHGSFFAYSLLETPAIPPCPAPTSPGPVPCLPLPRRWVEDERLENQQALSPAFWLWGVVGIHCAVLDLWSRDKPRMKEPRWGSQHHCLHLNGLFQPFTHFSIRLFSLCDL